MTDIALKAQEDLLCFDVSDEALEVAARGEDRRELYPWFLHGPVRVPRLTRLDGETATRRSFYFGQCPLLALSGHRLVHCTCLLLTQSGQGLGPQMRKEPHLLAALSVGLQSSACYRDLGVVSSL